LTAGTRRKSRELAMQMLFQADIGKQSPDQVRATFWKAADDVDPDVRGFAEDLFRVAVANQEQIDELLVANSKHWRLSDSDQRGAGDRAPLLRAGKHQLPEWHAGRHRPRPDRQLSPLLKQKSDCLMSFQQSCIHLAHAYLES
jgi:hypothetical protein